MYVFISYYLLRYICLLRLMSIPEKYKLLDEVAEVMRRHHYSIHTERSYSYWIKRYVRFHGMQKRGELFLGVRQKLKSS